MELLVTIKNVYGKDTVYPACERSVLLAELAGRKTLTQSDIKTIKKLGYTIKVIQAHPTTI